MGFAMSMINEGINNHHLKKIGDKDQEVVVILVKACGTKQNVHGTEVFTQEIYRVETTLSLDHYREQWFYGQRDMTYVRARLEMDVQFH